MHEDRFPKGSGRYMLNVQWPLNRNSLQDAVNAPPSSLSQVMEIAKKAESQSNMKLENGGDDGALDADKTGEAETVRSCEEALHNLEAAAENALQSFCKLATVNIGEEESKRFERLHAVERKIQAIAKLLQPPSMEKMR